MGVKMKTGTGSNRSKQREQRRKFNSSSPLPLCYLCFLLLNCFCLRASAAIWYASPTGLPGNTGLSASPWDLQTAFNKTATILPGDILLLRDGIYTHAPQGTVVGANEGWIFQITLTGTAALPITVMSFPGERARLDGGAVPWYHACARPTLYIGTQTPSTTAGAYIIVRDIEVYSSSTQSRTSTTDSSFPDDVTRSDGIYAQGVGIKIVNCVVHDCSTGISSFSSVSYGHEYYGNVLFNNGYRGTRNGFPSNHGHNFYLQGPDGPAGLVKSVKRNFSTSPYDLGMQAYGSGSAVVAHMRVTENCWLGGVGQHGGTLLGARNGVVADRVSDAQFINNYGYSADVAFYFQPDQIAYADLIATGNYFYKSFLQVSSWQSLVYTNNYMLNSMTNGYHVVSLVTNEAILPWTFDRNIYVINPGVAPNIATNDWVLEGLAFMTKPQWTAKTGYDVNSTVSHTLPSTNYVTVQNNAYDVNRAQAVVYNWSLGTNVVINVVPLGWATGDAVTIRNLQNYYGDVVSQVVSATQTLNLDMRAAFHSRAIPFGDTVALCPLSFPDFGAFILQRTSTNPPAVTTFTVTVASSNPSSGVTVSATSDNNGASTGTTTFTRLYDAATLVTLTAPAIGPGSSTFSKWQYNGADHATTAAITVTNSADATLTSFYTSPPPPPVVDYRRSALRRRVL